MTSDPTLFPSDRRRVAITGAAGGLGSAACRHLADHGWVIYAGDLPSTALDDLGGDPHIHPIPLDVTDPDAVAGFAASIEERTPVLAGVVNYAGILEVGPMIEMPEAVLRKVLEVNVLGMFRVNQALFPLLERGAGRIVNISSETGWQSGGPFNGSYAMSKHAVEAYSDSLRRELMFLEIPVIKVRPGPFRTAMVESVLERFERAAAASEHFGSLLQRTGDLASGEQDRAHDPEVLARIVEKALTTPRPRAAYWARPAPSRMMLELLPTSLADRAIHAVLSR